MSTPEDNEEGYRKCSILETELSNFNRVSGKSLHNLFNRKTDVIYKEIFSSFNHWDKIIKKNKFTKVSKEWNILNVEPLIIQVFKKPLHYIKQ